MQDISSGHSTARVQYFQYGTEERFTFQCPMMSSDWFCLGVRTVWDTIACGRVLRSTYEFRSPEPHHGTEKKSQNIFQRKGKENHTSPAKTANQEGLQSTPTLDHSSEKIMELSLPASPQPSRPGTPQDFATISSNCQGLLRLDIKGHSIFIDGCHRGINALVQAGLTDSNHPIMLENTRVLKNLNERYQQAVSEFTSHPPCNIPNCTLHTPNSTPVKNDSSEFPPLPKTTSIKRKENVDGFTPPTTKDF
ncbi:hypothetical protein TNCV_1927111 [Trichonephila clavipes]|nr:hypothetical protein TNCV_1927111 [Trichonephila clavipes]